jgi:hypothetical protein
MHENAPKGDEMKPFCLNFGETFISLLKTVSFLDQSVQAMRNEIVKIAEAVCSEYAPE